MTNEDILKILPPLAFEDLSELHQERYNESIVPNVEQQLIDGHLHWEYKSYGYADFPAFIVSVKYNTKEGPDTLHIQGERAWTGVLSQLFAGRVETIDELKTIIKCTARKDRTNDINNKSR